MWREHLNFRGNNATMSTKEMSRYPMLTQVQQVKVYYISLEISFSSTLENILGIPMRVAENRVYGNCCLVPYIYYAELLYASVDSMKS